MRVQDKMVASPHQKNAKTLWKENQCYADTPMVIKNYLQKQFADIVCAELEGVIISLICGPRSKPIVDTAERLLDQLVELTGEKCTLQTPKNGTQDIMVFVADQVAVWLHDVVDESDRMIVDRREKKLRGIEEGGKGDAGDDQDDVDEDVEIITKKKRPSAMSRPSQAGDGDGVAKKGPEKPSPTSSRPSKPKLSDDAGKDGGKAQASKKPAAKPKEGKTGDEKSDTSKGGDKNSVASKPKSKPATREGSKQGGGETKAPTDSKGGSKAGASGRTSGRASVSKSSSKPVDKKTTDKGPSSRPSTDGRSMSRTGTSKDQGKGTQDGVEKGSLGSGKSRGSQVPPQRPKTASEIRRDNLNEILSSHLSQLIQDTEKKSTPRQEALQDVISKKLEDKVGPRDSTTIDAIRDASALIASYIDKITENVEREYGDKTPAKNLVPVTQRGKGPVFSVRVQPSDYFIRQVTHSEAKTKVYKSRGLPAPGAISLTEGAFKPKETKEWANWANEVANMADRWSKWIDSTVSDAMKAADKRKAAGSPESAPSTSSWTDWKDAAGAEALEWRRNKKLLDTQAKLFSTKAESSVKPKSAPLPEAQKNQPKKKSP